jgi:hypothetical protein
MKSAFVLSILIASCGLVQAQEMLSLQEWARRPVDQQEVSYSFIRCAGLYEGTTNYIGAEMTKNYAASGQAIYDDPLMKSDLIFCKELTEGISR